MKFIKPAILKNRINSKENGYLIVDIRDENEYNDWNIKGSLNIPVNQYLAAGAVDKVKEAFSALPKDKEIVTVCARGVNSQVAAAILREMDYNAAPLEKGMKGW